MNTNFRKTELRFSVRSPVSCTALRTAPPAVFQSALASASDIPKLHDMQRVSRLAIHIRHVTNLFGRVSETFREVASFASQSSFGVVMKKQKNAVFEPLNAVQLNWLHRQPAGVTAAVESHLNQPATAGLHRQFVATLAERNATLNSGPHYEALLSLWDRLPTKLLFHMALMQKLDEGRICVLRMDAEMGLGRHGLEQTIRDDSTKHYYSRAVKELEISFDVTSNLSDVHSYLQRCQERHETIERKTINGETIPEAIWDWYCTQPVEVQEYLRRVACFADDDLAYNGDEFWMHGRHHGLLGWLQACAKEARGWQSGIELHHAFIAEMPELPPSPGR